MAAKKKPQKPKSKGEIKAKSNRGGSRAGAGRKPTAAAQLRQQQQAAGRVVSVEPIGPAGPEDAALLAAIKLLAPGAIEQLALLVNGGFKRVERRFACAGSVTARLPVRNEDGVIVLDPFRKPVMAEQVVFPELPAEALVEVARCESIDPPDRQAIVTVLDRVLGRPKQAVELKGEDGNAIRVEVYLPDNGRDPRPDETPEA